VLKYAHENGCPWNADTCMRAATDGRLHVLKWAIDNGCPYEVHEWTKRALQRLGLA